MKRFFINFFFSFVHINEYMFHFYSREKCSCLLSHHSAANTGTITTDEQSAKCQNSVCALNFYLHLLGSNQMYLFLFVLYKC